MTERKATSIAVVINDVLKSLVPQGRSVNSTAYDVQPLGSLWAHQSVEVQRNYSVRFDYHYKRFIKHC